MRLESSGLLQASYTPLARLLHASLHASYTPLARLFHVLEDGRSELALSLALLQLCCSSVAALLQLVLRHLLEDGRSSASRV